MHSLPIITSAQFGSTRSGNPGYRRRRLAAQRQMRNPPPRRSRLSVFDRRKKEEFIARRNDPDPRRYKTTRSTKEARVQELVNDSWRVKKNGRAFSVLGYLGHVYSVKNGICSCPYFEKTGSCYHGRIMKQTRTSWKRVTGKLSFFVYIHKSFSSK